MLGKIRFDLFTESETGAVACAEIKETHFAFVLYLSVAVAAVYVLCISLTTASNSAAWPPHLMSDGPRLIALSCRKGSWDHKRDRRSERDTQGVQELGRQAGESSLSVYLSFLVPHNERYPTQILIKVCNNKEEPY